MPRAYPPQHLAQRRVALHIFERGQTAVKLGGSAGEAVRQPDLGEARRDLVHLAANPPRLARGARRGLRTRRQARLGALTPANSAASTPYAPAARGPPTANALVPLVQAA